MRRHALPEQQTCLDETVECRLEFRFSACALPQPAEHERTLARSPRRSVPPPWPGRAGRAAPSVRRAGLQGRQRRGRNGRSRSRVAFALRFQHRLRHFLNEQRNAVSALDNVLPNTRRQRLVAGDAVDHGSDFALAEPIESECSDVRSSDPRRLELRSVRHDQQHPSVLIRPRSDQALQGSSGRSNAHPRRSSAPDWIATAPRLAQLALPASSVDAAVASSSSVG